MGELGLELAHGFDGDGLPADGPALYERVLELLMLARHLDFTPSEIKEASLARMKLEQVSELHTDRPKFGAEDAGTSIVRQRLEVLAVVLCELFDLSLCVAPPENAKVKNKTRCSGRRLFEALVSDPNSIES
jgi:hypothetical protein